MVDNLSQMKAKRLAEAQAYVEANLLVDTFANTLAEAESATLGDTRGDMNADARLYHSRTATHMPHRTTLGDVEANTLINKLADTFNYSKAERVRDIVDEAVVYTLVDMVLEREVERLGVTLDSCKTEALVYTLADTLAETKGERFGETLGDIETEAHDGSLADTQTEADATTLNDKVADVQFEEFVDTLAEILEESKAAIPGGTLGNVETKAIIDKLPGTLPGVEEVTFEEITLQCGG